MASFHTPSGWLTPISMQYGRQHKQDYPNTLDKAVRFRSPIRGQFRVEVIDRFTSKVISSAAFFSIGEARKAYAQELGGKPKKAFVADAGKEVIL